jgi:hypothetical protein
VEWGGDSGRKREGGGGLDKWGVRNAYEGSEATSAGQVRAVAVDERTYVTKVASWIDAILARRDDLAYGEARAEEHVVGGRKRLDLKVLGRVSGRVVLTGEVKMPDKPYGKNVFDGELVGDAFEKASRLGSPYYFTWNVNEFASSTSARMRVPIDTETCGMTR